MTAYQTAVMKLRDGEGSDPSARVRKRVVEGVFWREVSRGSAWGSSQLRALVVRDGLGAVYGIAQSSVRARPCWTPPITPSTG